MNTFGYTLTSYYIFKHRQNINKREHPWWVLSFLFYIAIDGFREWGYFTLMMVVRGFRPLAFALMVILPGAALERTMSWHLPW